MRKCVGFMYNPKNGIEAECCFNAVKDDLCDRHYYTSQANQTRQGESIMELKDRLFIYSVGSGKTAAVRFDYLDEEIDIESGLRKSIFIREFSYDEAKQIINKILYALEKPLRDEEDEVAYRNADGLRITEEEYYAMLAGSK